MQVEASPFDAQHYGLPIGRLVREPADGPGELDAAIDAARRERFAVVFLRLAGDDPLRGALDAGGHVPVDTLVTSTLGPRPPASPRHAELLIEAHDRLRDDADVAAVAAITGEAIRTSHLHADPRLPIERTRALYAAWATNDVTGRAQQTIVARAGGALIGYLTVVASPAAAPRTAMIDLVAVAAAWRGQGAGAALVGGFADWIDARGSDRPITATVGTQADNPALRLYQRCGFVPTATHVTYHLWLDG
ncbi:MAG TPA: GNAT family N-acetyltransferase [Kofleriaceae bacterium]|jgi:GNAT superfamily N-acetyltransferase|nr:GNAT family N-acetyltransferase [Kofleriaceae bacterium]